MNNILNNPIKRILLIWYMEEDNFGDVLIYQTVANRLMERGFQVESHEVGDDGRKIFEHANQCDFLLFAGGGIIERYVPPVIKHFKTNQHLLQVPYGVMGFGMGEFDYQMYEDAIKEWVLESAFFYVRDEATKKKLDIISKSDKVIYSADCVFGNKKLQNMVKKRGTHHGVNMRDLPYKDLTGDFNWVEMNQLLKEIGVDYLILDSSEESNKLNIGFENLNEIQKFLGLNRDEKIDVVIDEISRCKWIVAMRFHVVLVAAMLGVLTVPIKYCPKVSYLAKQLGIEELSLDIKDYVNIPYAIKILNGSEKKYSVIMNNNVDRMIKRANQMFEEVLTYLSNDEP